MLPPTMDSPDAPLVNGNWQYTRYVSTDKLIMPEGTHDKHDHKNLGFRLRRNKELICRRTRASDLAFFLAILGIVTVIIDTELQLNHTFTPYTPASIYLRVATSISTIGLLLCIVAYHVIGVKLRLVSMGVTNWRLATEFRNVVKLCVELLVCSIHPLPFGTTASVPMMVSDLDELHAFTTIRFPINSMFTILMFMRIYLAMRFIVMHSALFCDTTVQSLGAMSSVNINAQFVFKALMSQMPGVCLFSIMGTILFLNSYSLRLCEVYTLENHTDTFFMQTIWMTCVTFLTLGYGDVVPRTTCGRVLAIWTGMMGVGIMALCVAVLSRKLEQTRSQKYVHTFVQQIKMDKKYKQSAAKVIVQAITLWRLRRHGFGPDAKEVIIHRRRLNHAVKQMNRSQFLKSQFSESLVGSVEVSKNVNEIIDIVENVKHNQEELKSRMYNMEALVKDMHMQMSEMREMFKDRERRMATQSDL